MHADDLVVNDGGTREAIEGVAELLPHFDRVPTSALVVESVDAVDPSALVVASQQEEVFRVLDFIGE